MNDLEICQLAVLNDNYVYLVHDPASGKTACVDPAVAGPVLAELDAQGWELSHILITHPHFDHVDGIAEIVAATGAQVYGSRDDFGEIPKCDHGVLEGDEIKLGSVKIQVLEVPGHTVHHVAYNFVAAKILFVGDTLFSLGCGRLLGGVAPQMWNSLKKIRALPTATEIFCAHEYTQANGEFALSIDPDNADLQARVRDVATLRGKGLSTVPSTLAEEVRCNPFLRCDVPAFKAQLGLAERDAAEVFGEIRKQKDRF